MDWYLGSIYLFIIAFGLIALSILAVKYLIWGTDSEYDKPKRRKRKNKSNRLIYGDEHWYGGTYIEATPEEREAWRREEEIRTFWTKAYNYIQQYIHYGDLESLSVFITNIWETRDKYESAVDLHYMCQRIVEQLYPMRTVSEEYSVFILFVCDLAISNLDNFFSLSGNDCAIHIPMVSKKAIMLEKAGRIEEAMEVCDIGIKYQLKDPGYGNYAVRKSKLQQKLKNREK